MTLSKGFEPHLAIDETTVTSRDVEMLRAIDHCGSMHGAADELGRSYPHLQRRVVELEEAVGQLTRRSRGIGVVVATHDMHQAERVADRVAVLLDGRVTEVAPTEVVFEDPDDDRTRKFISGELVY